MHTMMIQLDNISKLKSFVDACSRIDAEMEVKSGSFISNPKSMLGLMTLNLSEPLELHVLASKEQAEDVFQILHDYRCDLING